MIEFRCVGYTPENWKQLSIILERGLRELCPIDLECPECLWEKCPAYKVCSDVARSVRYAHEKAESTQIDKKISNANAPRKRKAIDKADKV